MINAKSKSHRHRSLSDHLQRLRHIRGFGVHSAFAFRIVTDVVRPRKIYGYYAYHEIDCIEEKTPHHIQTPGGRWSASSAARMLLRLSVAMNPQRVFISRNLPSVMTRVMSSCNPKGEIRSRLDAAFIPELTVAEGEHPIINSLPGILANDGATAFVIGADQDVCDILFETLGEGVMLEAGKYMLIFSRSGMQKQRIRI